MKRVRTVSGFGLRCSRWSQCMQTPFVFGKRRFVVTGVHVVYPLGRTVVCIRERFSREIEGIDIFSDIRFYQAFFKLFWANVFL